MQQPIRACLQEEHFSSTSKPSRSQSSFNNRQGPRGHASHRSITRLGNLHPFPALHLPKGRPGLPGLGFSFLWVQVVPIAMAKAVCLSDSARRRPIAIRHRQPVSCAQPTMRSQSSHARARSNDYVIRNRSDSIAAATLTYFRHSRTVSQLLPAHRTMHAHARTHARTRTHTKARAKPQSLPCVHARACTLARLFNSARTRRL